MRSLFARIWLSYSLVLVLTLAAAVFVSFLAAVKRAEETDLISPVAFADSARSALTARGADGLYGWLVGQRHAHPELHVYFIDQKGRELLSRSVTRPAVAGDRKGPSFHGSLRPMASSIGCSFDERAMSSSVFRSCFFNLSYFSFSRSPSAAWDAVLAHYLTRPVVRLRAGVRAIAAGQLGTKMGGALARRKDELGGLARDIDLMAADMRAQMESKEELLRDISHELRSPLARLRVAAGLARRGAHEGKNETFDRIDLEVERLDAMIGQILRFSRLGTGPAPGLETVDLTDMLEETVEDAQLEAAPVGTTVRLMTKASVNVVGDRTMLRSAMENVLRNAVRFAPNGSLVEVRLSIEAEMARIDVLDEGPGLSETDLPHIFEPFFRADRSNGVGLGLAIAQRVVVLHGGRMVASNRDGAGLCMRMFLPWQVPATT